MTLDQTPVEVLQKEIRFYNDFIYRLVNHIDINPDSDQDNIDVLIGRCLIKIKEFENAIKKLQS